MDLHITMNLDNAAFGDDFEHEVRRTLEKVADRVARTSAVPASGSVMDVNGNTVGTWTLQ